MPHWWGPLLAFLAEQPAETTSVTLTVTEVAALGGEAMPAAGFTPRLLVGSWADVDGSALGSDQLAGGAYPWPAADLHL